MSGSQKRIDMNVVEMTVPSLSLFFASFMNIIGRYCTLLFVKSIFFAGFKLFLSGLKEGACRIWTVLQFCGLQDHFHKLEKLQKAQKKQARREDAWDLSPLHLHLSEEGQHGETH